MWVHTYIQKYIQKVSFYKIDVMHIIKSWCNNSHNILHIHTFYTFGILFEKGGGVQNEQFSDDVICEQPLSVHCL